MSVKVHPPRRRAPVTLLACRAPPAASEATLVGTLLPPTMLAVKLVAVRLRAVVAVTLARAKAPPLSLAALPWNRTPAVVRLQPGVLSRIAPPVVRFDATPLFMKVQLERDEMQPPTAASAPPEAATDPWPLESKVEAEAASEAPLSTYTAEP